MLQQQRKEDAEVRQTQRQSTPVSDAEKSAFPESDCLVTVDAVPVVEVPRHPTEGASSMVETDRRRPLHYDRPGECSSEKNCW